MIMVSEDLVSKKRHSEAARVLLDYSKDVREAVIALVQGNHFSEARRVVSMCIPQLSLISNYEVLGNAYFESRTLGTCYLSCRPRKLRPDHGGHR